MFEKIEVACNCSARKNSLFQNTYKNIYYNNKYDNKPKIENKKEKVDVLILSEFQENFSKFFPFYKYCNNFFNSKNIEFAIINALGCTPENFTSSDILLTYLSCKKLHVKKLIEEFSPKIIFTIGRALYTITESKTLKVAETIKDKSIGGHFYIPIESSRVQLKDYEIDDCWLYSPDFNCRVYPLPPLYRFVGFDNYEWKFVKQQFELAFNSLSIRKPRKITPEFINVKNIKEFFNKLINDENIKEIAIDTETSGLHFFEDNLYSLSISYNMNNSYFILFNNEVKEYLIKLFNTEKEFCFQNSPFDLKYLKVNGVHNARCTFDTMLAAHILNENSPNDLKSLAWVYTEFGGYNNRLLEYIKKYKIDNFTQLPENILLEYACYDSLVTFHLYKYFKRRLELEDISVKDNFYNYIMPAVDMIVDLELTGIQIDKNYIIEYIDNLKKETLEIEEEIYKIAGKKFNIASNKQLSEVLRNLPDFTVAQDSEGNKLLTKTGDLRVDKESLSIYHNDGLDIAKKIIDYNHAKKEISQIGLNENINDKSEIKNSLIKNIKEDISPEQTGLFASIYNNRLYGGLKLHGTKTGRMSGGGGLRGTVNLQNMPKTEKFRKIFLPSKGYVFAEFDFSMMEISIGSQISGKGPLEDLILEGKDIHCYTAAKVAELLDRNDIYKILDEKVFNSPKLQEKYKSVINFKEFICNLDLTYDGIIAQTKIEGKEEPIVEEFRSINKGVDFSAFYNTTAFGLSRNLKIDIKQAELFLKAFYLAYPEFKRYMDLYKKYVEMDGFTKTLLGRKRRLPKLTYQKIIIDYFVNIENLKTIERNLMSIRSNQINAALNSPIQGTSGQTTVIAMTNINKEFKKRRMNSKLLANVHDSILFELFIKELDEAHEIIKYYMTLPYYENVGGNKVKLEIDEKIGDIWGFGKSLNYWKIHENEWNELLNSIDRRNDLLTT